MYTALKGKGSFLNGQAIKVSACTDINRSLFLTPEVWAKPSPSNKTRTEAFKLQVENLGKIIPKVHAQRTMGSAAINLAMVAAGQADIYAEVGLHCWDMAAGILMVREAGGVVLDPRGKSISFDYMNRAILASASSALADQVLELDLKFIKMPRDHELSGMF